jgi:hypothetical protein
MILLIWNMVFMNVAGNILNHKYLLYNDIGKDMAGDLYEIRKTTDISGVKVVNYDSVVSNAMITAMERYPILQILRDRWDKVIFSAMLLKYNGQFFPYVRKGHPDDIRGATKTYDRMWYDLYIKKNTLIIYLKGQYGAVNSEKSSASSPNP